MFQDIKNVLFDIIYATFIYYITLWRRKQNKKMKKLFKSVQNIRVRITGGSKKSNTGQERR